MHQLLDPFSGAGPAAAVRRRWRDEWLYLKAAVRKLRGRLLLIVAVLLAGAALFQALYRESPGEPITFFRGLYYTWCLIFFEPPVDLPNSLVLDAMFFVIPLLGLLVLIETFVELSLMLRDRRRNESEWCKMIAAEMNRHTVLVGFGRLGYRTYGHLRRMGVQTVVIESDADNRFLEMPRVDRTPVLIGDGRVDQILKAANIEKAASIICCTNDDLANLEMALDARTFNPGIRVVLRMFDQNLANKVRDGFSIHVAFSTAAMAAPSFAAAAADSTIKSSHMVDGRLVVTSEISIGPASELAGQSLLALRQRIAMNVVAHHPPGKRASVFPLATHVLSVGDRLLVQLLFSDLAELHRLNHTEGVFNETMG